VDVREVPDADETLTTQMKSVGEAMAIGRTFKEALQKGIRSMEVKRFGFGLDKYDKWLMAQKANDLRGTGVPPVGERSSQNHGRDAHATKLEGRPHDSVESRDGRGELETKQPQIIGDQQGPWPIPEETLRRKLAVPSQGRLYYARYALKMGWSIEQVHELTKYDPWFIGQMKELVEFESELSSFGWTRGSAYLHETLLTRAKELGYSDVQLNEISKSHSPADVGFDARSDRESKGIRPVYKLVDTCAAEFEAATPYYYSTYESAIASSGPHPSPLPEGEGTRGNAPSSSRSTLNSQLSTEDEIRLTDKRRSSSSAAAPTGSGRASSSTTAACMPPSRCASSGTSR
jgi:carbamoyl-phosphate synthase large subunit